MLTLLLLFLGAGCSKSSKEIVTNVSIESKVSRSTINIGDTVRYSVILKVPKDYKIQAPSRAANLGQFEIKDYNVVPPLKMGKGGRQEQTDYIVSTYDVGEYTIPPLRVTYTSPSGAAGELFTSPIVVTVKSLNPSEVGDIKDVKPPLPVSRNWLKIGLIGGAILLLVGVTIFYFIYYRRLRRRLAQALGLYTPPVPPHTRAFEALSELKGSNALLNNDFKLWYCTLSDILRIYYEGRYNFLALEETTDEIESGLERTNMPRDCRVDSRNFLMEADMVKFAKVQPNTIEAEESFRVVWRIVERTIPPPEITMPVSETGRSETQVKTEEVGA